MSVRNPIEVKAVDASTIILTVNKEFYLVSKKEFRLYEDGEFVRNLVSENISESGSSFVVTIKTKPILYKPGIEFQIATKDNYFFSIDFSYMAYTDEFDRKYRYEGRLGSEYRKDRTSFAVFAPFATRVILNIQKRGGKKEVHLLSHDFNSGVCSTVLEGDYEGAKYTYSVTNFSKTSEVIDPYSFSLDSNARHSFVIDEDKVKRIPTFSEMVKPDTDLSKMIVYECDVRDMTSLSDIRHRGTFDALSKTMVPYMGKSLGIDYIASLGVSHVQLLPTMDFQTVDEDHPLKEYNWGYDPNSYFSPEGSYALNPSDPYSRMIEFRELVASFHRRGLKVVQDVVYNHLYSTKYNALVLLVPGYYLRKNLDGTLSNGSGCGNDLESRQFMVRKLILDSMLHYLDFYDIDGFRFDLMGILDVDTLNEAKRKCDEKKKGLVFYGEGWDLWTALSSQEKASISNSSKLSGFGFFNDRFRDIVKGKSGEYDLAVRGYLLGDGNYIDGFKHVLMGSSRPFAFAPLFLSPYQSINYVECHDNHTLFDKISKACPDDTRTEILKRIKMMDVCLLLSCGIPFFHAGQEFGQSKNGQGNTYNMGDRYNGFDYSLLEKRKEMVVFFREAIRLRNLLLGLCGRECSHLEDHIRFEDLEQGALHVSYEFSSFSIHVIYNPMKEKVFYSFDDYVKLIFNESGNVDESDVFVRMAIINALSVDVFLKKKEDSGC